METSNLSRRELFGVVLLAPAIVRAGPLAKHKISIFSKHLQFLEGDALAAAVAEIGFEGVDLAVRKGGHIEPGNATTELPKLYGQFKKHGVEVTMLTTDIVDADSPYASEVLGTMQSLGIRHYRWGGFKWTDAKPFGQQIEDFKPRVDRLAKLNARYGATAMYHTHSGVGVVGASIWDLHEILAGFDPKLVGINYDIGHATVEGGLGGWIDSFKIAGDYVQGVAIKDFLWEKTAKGDYKDNWKPLGEGMVKLQQFATMLSATKFDGPLQIHYEYPLGGADLGRKNPTMPKEEIFAYMKKDLLALRGMLAK